ncbi:hypothetical protein CLAFUW4_04599 [Fulvia fulva]|uniref:uncharacterized protein n=1 Tax=Passalora fulva TaxID=5499 RepID=UPI0028526C87|nr:uncharacterized protein CLAFUR5_20183 [Fulvia fulva]KAK4626182.1 hypothetical protein CLAFUR4_04585 [Fulvia fulva]WMI38866.1 hypothetical protein CLAFUR5_20183 [Fulvia fulva]WPV13730.1 hypothetical protein CLAFUW4_04599 [Fulvia fulva]WPV28216.1 hypothetical protein CLAFUW7_04591 [Fulvia fulva]
MPDLTHSADSAGTDCAIQSDMVDSSMWSPVKALSASIAAAFTSVMGSLDRKAGELLGMPVSNSSADQSPKEALEKSAVIVDRYSGKVRPDAMAAVDSRLISHLRQGYQRWHVRSPPSTSGESTPRARSSGLSLSSYAAMARSFLPGARIKRPKRTTTAADITLIDSLDSSFTPTLSKFGLDNDSDDEDQDGL